MIIKKKLYWLISPAYAYKNQTAKQKMCRQKEKDILLAIHWFTFVPEKHRNVYRQVKNIET